MVLPGFRRQLQLRRLLSHLLYCQPRYAVANNRNRSNNATRNVFFNLLYVRTCIAAVIVGILPVEALPLDNEELEVGSSVTCAILLVVLPFTIVVMNRIM